MNQNSSGLNNVVIYGCVNSYAAEESAGFSGKFNSREFLYFSARCNLNSFDAAINFTMLRLFAR